MPEQSKHPIRRRSLAALSSALLAALVVAAAALAGCDGDGVGDPCIPEDEFRANFHGFSEQQVNAESRSFQCETRTCLVTNFRGRVSCPYGQSEGETSCKLPGDQTVSVEVAVEPQLVARPPEDAVYCSCRCAGSDPSATYCDCPSGFTCEDVIPEVTARSRQLAGSYCIKAGTHVGNPAEIPLDGCSADRMNCGDVAPYAR